MRQIYYLFIVIAFDCNILVAAQAIDSIDLKKELNKTSNLDIEDKKIDMIIDSSNIHFNAHKMMPIVCEEQENTPEKKDEKPSKIQALKVAYLSSKLNLKVDESESFWPKYNEYVGELKKLKDIVNEIEKDEKILEVRKKYKENFDKIIGAEKTNTLFKSEKEFKKLMQETLIKQKMSQQSAGN